MEFLRLARRAFRNPIEVGRFLKKHIVGMRFTRGVQRIIQVDLGEFVALVRANEDVGLHILSSGNYEQRYADYLRRHIQRNDVCVDVGANTGFFSLLMSFATGAGGQVHSFEPIPINYHLLSVNVLLNRFTNVVISDCCVGSVDGSVDFSLSADSAYSSMRPTGRKAEIEHLERKVMTLDSYVEEHKLGKVNVVKIDVEGTEEEVLKGARALFSGSRSRPRFAMIELNSQNLATYESDIPRVLGIMREYGYEAFVLIGRNRLRPYVRGDWNLEENVIFLASELKE